MRVAVLLLLAGCPLSAGPSSGECDTDSDCGGNVCARDGLCYPASEVRQVKTTWTILGQPASPTTCGPVTDLEIGYSGNTTGASPIAYAPVPCENGQFVMDKLPRTYTRVELGKVRGFSQAKLIGATGVVEFDLHN